MQTVALQSITLNIRGFQRWFPPKYIENTFEAIQSTFRSLEMHSKPGALKFVFVQLS